MIKRIILATIAAGACAVSPGAPAQDTKVAVLGDPALADLVDLTTSDLSNRHDLQVLSRDDLDKLGQEQQIDAVLGAGNLSGVHLLSADGLVLLRATDRDGKKGAFARLVAVQPGIVLREIALPEDADPPARAQVLEKEFAPYWPKLAGIQKNTITALSLLGLRFDSDSPMTRDLERQINILLASRLGAEPDFVVLERWRLNDVLFEKSIGTPDPSPFWTGSSLVDGGMQLKDGQILVKLRMRPPQGQEITISDQDTPENLPALVERLVSRMETHPAATSPWKPGDEAQHFAALGKWCIENSLYDQGAEALESAVALGDTSRATLMLRIKAYAMEAYPNKQSFGVLYPDSDDYHPELMTQDNLPQRMQAAQRAAELTMDFLARFQDSDPKFNLENPTDLGVPVLYNCLRTLRAAYDAQWATAHPDEFAALRRAVESLIAALGEKLLPQPNSLKRGAYLNNRAYYAAFWHEKPEDTTEFYRQMLKDKDVAWVEGMLFTESRAHEPYLDGEGEAFSQSPWSKGPPWIASWDGKTSDEMKTLWQNFIQELAVSPDLVLQCASFKFERASNLTRTGRDTVQARFVPFLLKNVNFITSPRGGDFVAGIGSLLSGATDNKVDPNSAAEIAPLYLALFKEHVLLPTPWIAEMVTLISNNSPADTAGQLLNAFDDYAQWYKTQPQSYDMTTTLDQVRNYIYQMRPELVPKATLMIVPPLAVEQLWDNRTPAQANIIDSLKGFSIDTRTIVTEGKNVWFMAGATPREIYCVDSSTLQVVSKVQMPEEVDPKHHPDPQHLEFPQFPAFLEVTPDWLVVGANGKVLLGSRSDNSWRALDLPLSYYKPRWINQQLYAIYDAFGVRASERDPNGLHSAVSGIVHISLPDGTTDEMVDSRRIPPQSNLDGRALGTGMELWQSQTGLTAAFALHQTPFFQVYSSPFGKNEWTPFITENFPCAVQASQGGVFITKGLSQLGITELIFSSANGNRILLSTSANDKPEWNYPTGICKSGSPVIRGDDFCLFFQDEDRVKSGVTDGSQFALCYFAKGVKDGVKIPLAFDMQKVKNPVVTRAMPPSGPPHATDYGLVFGQPACGLWIIPWTDIDAYRAKMGVANR